MLFLVLIINALALLITERIVPGVFVADFKTAIFIALILGIVNTFAKHFLAVLTVPLSLFSLTLFTFVINAISLYIISLTVDGFMVRGASSALLGAVALSLISTALIHLVLRLTPKPKIKKSKRK